MYYHFVALYFTVYIVISHFKGTLYTSSLDSQYYKRQLKYINSSDADDKT